MHSTMLFRVGILSACLIAGISAASEGASSDQEWNPENWQHFVTLEMIKQCREKTYRKGICHRVMGFIEKAPQERGGFNGEEVMTVRVCAGHYTLDAPDSKKLALHEMRKPHTIVLKKSGVDRQRGDDDNRSQLQRIGWTGRSSYRDGRLTEETFIDYDGQRRKKAYIWRIVTLERSQGKQLEKPQKPAIIPSMKGCFVKLQLYNKTDFKFDIVRAEIKQVECKEHKSGLWWSEPRVRLETLSVNGQEKEKSKFCCRACWNGDYRWLVEVDHDGFEINEAKPFQSGLPNQNHAREMAVLSENAVDNLKIGDYVRPYNREPTFRELASRAELQRE